MAAPPDGPAPDAAAEPAQGTAQDPAADNAEAFRRQCAAVEAARRLAAAGGPAEAVARHQARGKLTARRRIALLLDPATPFLEIGALAAHGVYDEPVPAAGIVTGIGSVGGRLAMIMANDATVKGGTYYPLTVKKQVRAQQVARENGLPSIYLVDSGGAFLPLQEEIFPDAHHFGAIFRNMAEMSALGLPQIAAVMGSCTAGGAYIPAMADETVIVRGTGTIFLGGPQLVQAATGVVVDAETLGGADLHTSRSAVADHLADDDVAALATVRAILARAPAPPLPGPDLPPEPPLGPAFEIAGLIPQSPRQRLPAREILARLIDGGRLDEYRARYARTIICGTAAIAGYRVGVLMNDGVLYAESAQKAANFIELCCQRQVPLLFLHNISGFMVGEAYEAGGIARHGAKLVNAVATAAVPKFSLLVGGSYGAGNYAMCGRAFGPRLMAMWPNARTSVMGGEQAATVLGLVREEQLRKAGQSFDAEARARFEAPIRAAYEASSHPIHAAARLWVDAVIEPEDTRAFLALALAMAKGGPKGETRFGVFRM
ncbi:carboxyl transferase domain-containing protein [Xanthobacter sp. KR7-225]|uniref:carboxyl transferase domain-containing protein n=1 Tax=Xanthobacter sp. KR7-225 TaxID=3156613 RepID=UPI0032B52253